MDNVVEIIGRNSLSKHVRNITWGKLVNTLMCTCTVSFRYNNLITKKFQ